MISLLNVTKFYKTNSGKRVILDNISLTIPEKTNIAILGRNGSGKSTFMRMLGKIEYPNSGTIESTKTFSWPLGLSGGFIPNLTGKANVKFVCRLYGKNEEEIKNIIQYVKEFSELGEYFEMPIKTYSSGMRGRLGFGLSLAFNFDYMLIDETLSVGDAKFKQKSKDALMEKIKKCNILFVSHDMKTVSQLCDSGIILHEGQMFYFDNVDEAIKEYININKTNKG
jgi:capsular polysaccharide transport system ATP-binding protein